MAQSHFATCAELRDWLVNRVAFYLNQSATSIDPGTDLARYGVDSVYALSLVGDLEDHLEMELDVAEVRKRQTIDDLVEYVMGLTCR